ncbi:hypothetical protein N7453_005459 [Penicillium expansum]|nr:hypothetical protein N7453_005459 [Penicillium expansum]
MISKTLEDAICFALWMVLILSSFTMFEPQGLVITWLSEEQDHAATRKKQKKKWLDDKKRLLAESRAIFDREAYLIEQLQRGEDRMTKGVVSDAGLEFISVVDRSLDLHRFKIRQNWRELADLLDRYTN